jgi:purine-binding chemotaxis protein CheW
MIDEDDEESRGPLIRWITFRLGSEIYGIEVQQVREILRINNIFPVPGAPDCVVGITNIRGNVITVIDARSLLRLETAELTEDARMIVLETRDEIAAIIVDSVSDVVDLPVSAIDANPRVHPRKDSRYINGVISHADELIIILNIDSFQMDENCEAAVAG